MRRSVSVAVLITVAALGIATLGAKNSAVAAQEKTQNAEVKIDNFSFGPAALTVSAGSTVTWTNRDDIPHTVVCAGKFRSKTMDTDGTFSFTFTAPGEYKYFCSLHPHMTGAVKVE